MIHAPNQSGQSPLQGMPFGFPETAIPQGSTDTLVINDPTLYKIMPLTLTVHEGNAHEFNIVGLAIGDSLIMGGEHQRPVLAEIFSPRTNAPVRFDQTFYPNGPIRLTVKNVGNGQRIFRGAIILHKRERWMDTNRKGHPFHG